MGRWDAIDPLGESQLRSTPPQLLEGAQSEFIWQLVSATLRVRAHRKKTPAILALTRGDPSAIPSLYSYLSASVGAMRDAFRAGT